MCGINGMIFLKGFERTEAQLKQVKFLFNELMVQTQDRGHHATGLTMFNRNGEYVLHKDKITADEMTTTDKTYSGIIDSISDETSAIIAHTRYYTKGLPSNHKNNHPFDIGNIIGLHNGSIKNDDELFKKYEFAREGEVDSEIIFQLLNHYNSGEITFKGLQSALEDTQLKGLVALAFMNKNQPNLVHLVKQEKPMALAYWADLGIVIFNSIEEYVEKAFNQLIRVNRVFGLDVEPNVKYYTVKDDVYFTVDSNATNADDAISLTQKLYITSTSVKTYSYGSAWKDGKYIGTSTTTTSNTPTTTVNAKDSKGIVIQGELNELTGEITIFGGMTELNSDDGSGIFDDEVVFPTPCCECDADLSEYETNATWNNGAVAEYMICESCYKEVLGDYITERSVAEAN